MEVDEKEFLTLKEVQFEAKEMLKVVVDFLEKNNFNYYIWDGTFLGAVRHKGFIPWDDDIDLAMTRPEYDKLVNYLKEKGNYISDNLFFEGYDLGNNTDFPILKVYNKDISVDDFTEKVDKYLWIDIFPLDAIPKDDKKFYKKCRFLYNILLLKREQKNGVKLMAANKFKLIIKNIFLFVLRIWNYDSYFKFYCNFCKQYDYDECKYLKNLVMIDTDAYCEKEDLVSCKYEFEDLFVNGVKDYDKYLSLQYGDYMSLPPEENRVAHGVKAWKRK